MQQLYSSKRKPGAVYAHIIASELLGRSRGGALHNPRSHPPCNPDIIEGWLTLKAFTKDRVHRASHICLLIYALMNQL